MLCPECFSETSVIDSRPSEDGDIIRRRRKCSECSHTFSTMEVETDWLIKRIGSKIIRTRKTRISKNDYYLGIAKAVSMRSTCLKRQYGAVIVKNDEIISTGYNGSVRSETNCCDVGVCKRINTPHNTGDYSDCESVHAEQNAIISAKRSDLLGSTLYLYGEEKELPINAEPCPICKRMIKNAGIVRVVCGKENME